VENILPRGRRRRFINGVVATALALVTAVFLVRHQAAAAWFTLDFVLVFVAALMLLQARDKT